jgi:hypothetical protein
LAPAWASVLKSATSPPPEGKYDGGKYDGGKAEAKPDGATAKGKYEGESPKRPLPSVPKGRSQSAKRGNHSPVRKPDGSSSGSATRSGGLLPPALTEAKRTSRSAERQPLASAGSAGSAGTSGRAPFARPAAALGSPDKSSHRAATRGQVYEAARAAELATVSLATGDDLLPSLAHARRTSEQRAGDVTEVRDFRLTSPRLSLSLSLLFFLVVCCIVDFCVYSSFFFGLLEYF